MKYFYNGEEYTSLRDAEVAAQELAAQSLCDAGEGGITAEDGTMYNLSIEIRAVSSDEEGSPAP